MGLETVRVGDIFWNIGRGREDAQQRERELQSVGLRQPRNVSQHRSSRRETRGRHLDVPPSQASIVHPRHLPPVRTPLEYLPPPISLLPHTLITNCPQYKPGFNITTSGAPRLSFRIFAVRYVGTMGQCGKQAGEEAEHYYRAHTLYYFKHRFRVLNKHTGGDVLAGLGWHWEWEYGSYEDNDGGDR